MWLTMTPILAPICARGPSLPIHRPPDTANTVPKIFVISVLKPIISGTFTPFKILISSAIPEPEAPGPNQMVIDAASATSTIAESTKNDNE